jgi:FixJ family two-component response regulator
MCAAFSSGALALADPSALEAACLVTDYRMAGMSGLDLLRGLRAVGWRRPAILITAHRSDYIEDSEGALSMGILEKPLLDRRLLRLRRSRHWPRLSYRLDVQLVWISAASK